MSIFEIIGPVMVGPSSSHTAGAARIGLVSRRLFGELPKEAVITLYGSFAETYFGHGTDKALIGGLLGLSVSDLRMKDSFVLAEQAGLRFSFVLGGVSELHPNTAKLVLKNDTKELSVTAASVGGGSIRVKQIDGADVDFSAKYHTLVVFSLDRTGTVTAVTGALAEHKVNIAFMRLFREDEGKKAVMVIETDSSVTAELCATIEQLAYIHQVVYLPPLQEKEGDNREGGEGLSWE